MDRRYPHLIPVDELPRTMPGRSSIAKFAKRVFDNTTARTALNTHSNRLYFYYREVAYGVYDHDRFDLSDTALAGVCRTIKSGRLSAAFKTWLLDNAERERQSQKEQAMGLLHENNRKDAERIAARFTRNRVTAGYGTKGVT